MLAQIQIKFGYQNYQKYEEAMAHVKAVFESQGIFLKNGLITKVGKLYQAWNLWEIEDYEHVSRAMLAGSSHPKLGSALQGLAESVESETVHFLESMPFSPDFN